MASALESTLVEWINTFEGLSKKCEDFTDLADGIVLGEVLSEISPLHLDRQQIKHEARANEFLRLSNVRHVLHAMQSFYADELGGSAGQQLVAPVDASAVARGDGEHVERVVRLLLGMVVETKDNARFVQNIMKLSPSHQAQIMRLLQEITSQHAQQRSEQRSTDEEFFRQELDAQAPAAAASSVAEDDGGSLGELSRTGSPEQQREVQAALRNELEHVRLEHDALQAETGRMRQERDELQRMLKSVERELSDERKANAELKAHQELHSSHEHHHASQQLPSRALDGTEWAEQRAASMEQELDERNAQIAELKKKVDELSKLASEARSMRDSIDIYKERAAMVETLEERLKKLQLKADSVPDLKKHIKSLEEQNENSMKQIIELEEAAKKSQALKAQVDKLKDQLTELQAEKTSLLATIDDKDAEIVRERDAHGQLRSEHRQLAQQLERLERKQQQHQAEAVQSPLSASAERAAAADEAAGSGDLGGGGLGGQLLDMATKERLQRLELENQRLRAAASDSSRQELEDKLDDATRLNAKYALDIQALQRRLKDAASDSSSGGGGDGVAGAGGPARAELQSKLTALESENKRLSLEVLSLQSKLKAAAERVAAMSQEKQKLEGYLRTARQMIKDERAKASENSQHNTEAIRRELDEAAQGLRRQLADKDKELDSLKRQLEESKEASARELKLMSSALYEVGIELQRLKAPRPDLGPNSPLGNQTKPQSLLAQKRNQNR